MTTNDAPYVAATRSSLATVATDFSQKSSFAPHRLIR